MSRLVKLYTSLLTLYADIPSLDECLQKAEQYLAVHDYVRALKHYLVSSSPEIALDIGLNSIRGTQYK